MVPGLGLNAQHFGRIRLRRRGATPSALARVHLTFDEFLIEPKKPQHSAEAFKLWCPVSESNQGHEDFQSSALPTELTGRRK